MLAIQPNRTNNSTNFQAAALGGATRLSDKQRTGNAGGKISIVRLGSLPKSFYAPTAVGGTAAAEQFRRETSVERLRRQTEERRFTVEALIEQIERNLGFVVKVTRDGRGAANGNRVRLRIGGCGGHEISISTLPVEAAAAESETAAAVDYFVWEISIDDCCILRPRAGRGSAALNKCLQKIRQSVNGY